MSRITLERGTVKELPASREVQTQQQFALLALFQVGDAVNRPDLHPCQCGRIEGLIPPRSLYDKAWARVRWSRGSRVVIALEALQRLAGEQDTPAGRSKHGSMETITRPELPRLEVDLLLSTVDEAIDLCHAKRPEDGARELRYGLNRARAALEDNEPWAPELVERWSRVLTNYCFERRINLRELDRARDEEEGTDDL